MRRFLASVLGVAMTLVVIGAPGTARATDTGAEADFTNRINSVRASRGLAPLGTHSVLTAKAQLWAQHMADTACLCHSNLPDGVTVSWRKLGENIGRGPSVDAIHNALVNSAPHLANMVDPAFHWVGVGVAYRGSQMYVAEVFMDGAAPPPSGPVTRWSPWLGIGGTLTSAPAVASWASNRIDVFVRGTDGNLWHQAWTGGWSGWEPFGAPPGGLAGDDPTAVASATGRIDVFARGSDSHLWHRVYDGALSHPWENLGGTLTSGPSAASWAPGRLDVLARGAGGDLVHRYLDGGGWSGWESLGGFLTSAPAAVSWAPDRLDIFVRGSDNQMWQRWWAGAGWSGWLAQGGQLGSGPAVASWGPGRLDVFVAGSDHQMWQKYYDGSWHGYLPLGGTLTSTPGAASMSPGHVDVYVRGSDSRGYHKWWD